MAVATKPTGARAFNLRANLARAGGGKALSVTEFRHSFFSLRFDVADISEQKSHSRMKHFRFDAFLMCHQRNGAGL
jgi:hypothetical protein